jgi:hypothetical protein
MIEGSIFNITGAARRGFPDLPIGALRRAEAGSNMGGAQGLKLGHAKSFTDLRAMTATRGISAELSITTDEGDVVTLHAASSTEVSYASLRHKERGADGASHQSLSTREVSLTREISMTVEGDLSEEELADIRKLVARLEPVLRGFKPGKGEAFALRLDASEFESLAGFQLDIERTSSMTRLHVRQRTWGQAPQLETTGTVKPAPVRMPVSQPPADDAGETFVTARPEPQRMPVSRMAPRD